MPQAAHSYLEGRVRLCVGDLTEQAVDAIVNAANSTLLGGGGVDGAIHRRGGPAILDACRALRASAWPNGLPTGQVALTEGGRLPARYVIHAVGPIHGRHGGKEAALLAACYGNALSLAAGLVLRTIAFPAISTGVYGYPPDEAAVVVSTTLREQLPRHAAIDEVRLVFFDSGQLEIFAANQRF
ncbi:O-acetyl-ADP-ribose deacetylase [uncultured Dechloromonas sp.]|uniref:O-acetyl-ADP-ribose deacetylase n=1 Tax=uncultured Dechloromonas sp. TaxID=171719 RepID=UPI0025E9C8D6|nr:O-acetyl-ADP-ribose deacetylase [uncultured Dechloromonas sp.]